MKSSPKKTRISITTPAGRELWIDALGMPAVLPPEEEKDVKTAIGAARAKQARGDRL